MQKRNPPYKSLENALNIMKSFLPQNPEKGTVEISQELGLNVSTVSRILRTLNKNGFLQINSRTKQYSLGRTSLELGRAVHQSIHDRFIIIAQPHIDNLRDKLGIDVALEVLVGDSTILAYRAWGPQKYKIRFSIGDRIPVHVAAGAKAIMAFSSPETVDRLLEGELIQMTPNTITNPVKIKKKLDKFKKDGVAYDMGESDVSYKFVAAPIFDYEKRPVAAVVVGETFNGEYFELNLIQMVKETAKKVSYELHYREDSH